MFHESRRATAHPTRWGITPDSPKLPGMRIERGRWNVFVPDEELLDLATQIADHLAGNDRPNTYTTQTPEA